MLPRLTVVLLGITALAAAAAAEPATRPAGVTAVLERLGDDSFAVREAAQRDLLRLALDDPAAAEAVERAARDHPDDEVRARCRTTVEAVGDARRFGASRITLRLTDVPAEEAARAFLAAVTEATAVPGGADDANPPPRFWPSAEAPFADAPQLGERPVSLDLDGAPFWDAVDAFGRATGLWPVQHEEGFALSRHGQPVGQYPRGDATEDAAAVAVELVSASQVRSSQVEFGVGDDGHVRADGRGGGGQGTLSLQLRLLVEPKLRPTGQTTVALDRAVDEAGRDLLVPAGDGRHHGGFHHGGPGSWLRQASVGLDAEAARDSARIAELSGRVTLGVVEATERMSIDVGESLDRLSDSVGEAGEAGEEGEEAGEAGGDAEGGVSVPVGATAELGKWRVEVAEVRGTPMPRRWDEPVAQARPPGVVRLGEAVAGALGLRLDNDGGDEGPRRPRFREVVFTIRLDGGVSRSDPDFWQFVQQARQDVRLVDAQGRRWGTSRFDQDFDPRGERLTLTLGFVPQGQEAGAADRLEWSVPTRTRAIEVPFAFRDVPLPSLD